MARFSDDQLGLAKLRLHDALESVAVAFWTDEDRYQAAIERALSAAVGALGFRLVADPDANE